MQTLTGISDPIAGKTFEVSEASIRIGRSAENGIAIEDGTVSSRHCELIRKDGGCFLRDLGSTNQTRVNGEVIETQRLSNGDTVLVGSVELRFADDAEPAAESQDGEDATAPEPPASSSGRVSPFEAKKAPTGNRWFVFAAVLVLLALAGVGVLVYRLLTAT